MKKSFSDGPEYSIIKDSMENLFYPGKLFRQRPVCQESFTGIERLSSDERKEKHGCFIIDIYWIYVFVTGG